jgi:hypothetical protein
MDRTHLRFFVNALVVLGVSEVVILVTEQVLEFVAIHFYGVDFKYTVEAAERIRHKFLRPDLFY